VVEPFETERTELEAERRELEALLDRQLDELLEEAGPLDEAAPLEEVGTHFATRLGQDEELRELLLERLVAKRDPRGAALLEATGRFTAGGVGVEIDAALGRLEEAAVEAPQLPLNFADLHVPRVLRARSDVVDNYLAWVERVGDEEEPRLASLTVLTIEQGPGGGPLVDGGLSPPLDADAAKRELDTILAEAATAEDAIAVEEIGAAELGSALERACAQNRRQEWEVSFGVGSALPLLAVALRGEPGAFGEVGVREPPRGLYADPGDEAGFHELARALLDDFTDWAERSGGDNGPAARSGHLIAGSMLEWKWREGDGMLSNWTEGDIGDFLLDHLPRQVTTNAEIEADAADCVICFLSFLEEEDILYGDPLDALAECCRELRDAFADVAGDRDRWGPAKALAMQMQAEGVDIRDPAAVETWMADYNARPFEERDRIVGPALDGAAGAAGASDRSGEQRAGAKAKRARRAKRKAARAARRRGRH
jgi:hypothetical protein